MLSGPPLPGPTSLIMGAADSGHSSGSGSSDTGAPPRYTAAQGVVESVSVHTNAIGI